MNCPEDRVLLAMVEHSLDPAQHQAIEGHVDSCAHCREVVASVLGAGSTAIGVSAEAEPEKSIVGVTINEAYIVKTLLGRGGMGTVYLARDRTLGRDVAIKLHRPGSGGDRLHREAIAMARLAHPNVVTVFEIAAYEDRLYVAMEYVGGDTLRTWVTQPRGWREILELLLAAGSGLAAAHTAGLVHRDFKPENVLVGDDGRPRVSDFGLARSASRASVSGDIVLSAGSLEDMTQTGALMGTPSYMAYEQLAGGAVDARSDQFAFCVVVWECLFGKRPFEGTTIATLAVAIDRQEIIEPTSTQVPPRVREVLRRGLAADPEHRYADMPALLAALRTAMAPRSRRTLAIAIGATTLVGGGIAFALFQTLPAATPAATCAVPPDALAGAWDATLQEKLRGAFATTRPADGEQIYGRTSKILDDYTTSWTAMRRSACDATARGVQSPALLDLRMACLDRRRDELRAVTQGLAEPDDKLVMGSVRAALGLASIAECGDLASLSAPIRPPEESVRARVEAERSALASARGLRLLGRIDAALEQTEAIATRAAALKYRPLEAEVLLVLGDLKDRSGDSASAIKVLEQAVVAADAGNHQLAAAQAWSTLAWILGYGERQFERAELAVKMASARIESLGGNGDLEAQLANYEGLILETKGQLEPAKARYLAALDKFEQIGERDTWKVSMALNDLGGCERKLRDLPAARKHHERALAIRRRVFGEHHPYVFSSLNNLGNVAWSGEDFPLAEKWFGQAIAVAEAVFPPKHPQLALVLANLASAYERQDKLAESLAMFRRALAMSEAVRGPDHPDVAENLRNIGNVLVDLGQKDEARRSYERALAISDKKEADPDLAQLLHDYGDMLVQEKEYAAADKFLQRSLAVGDKVNPKDPENAYALTALGELRMKTGRHADAKTYLERALELRKADVPRDELARTELALATVLWRSPADRARARELAESAKKHAGETKATSRKLHQAIATWLESHR
jgi:tetratricopeptide (TPR) repeat protein/tRNA A-37 threonylcarbamoyl transferase component Bud32